jgi:hypothetical protein
MNAHLAIFLPIMLNGDAVVNTKKRVFHIDEPSQGVVLLRLDTGAQIQTFHIDVKRLNRPYCKGKGRPNT